MLDVEVVVEELVVVSIAITGEVCEGVVGVVGVGVMISNSGGKLCARGRWVVEASSSKKGGVAVGTGEGVVVTLCEFGWVLLKKGAGGLLVLWVWYGWGWVPVAVR